MDFFKKTILADRPDVCPTFGQTFTDYMFIMDYEDSQWKKPRLVPFNNLSISPSMFSLHYGQTIFEGMKAYKQANGEVVLFRPLDHLKRFNFSARRLVMPEIDIPFILEVLKFHINEEKRWFYDGNQASLYIRPFMFASEESIGVKIVKKFRFMIIMSPVQAYYKGAVKLKCEDYYSKACPGGVGEAETGGNYAASLLAMKGANDEGYDQVLWLDSARKKFIEDAGVMNIFFMIDNIIATPALTGTILKLSLIHI